MDLGTTGIGWVNQLGIPFFWIFCGFFDDSEVYEYTTEMDLYLETRILKKIPRVILEAKYRKMPKHDFF